MSVTLCGYFSLTLTIIIKDIETFTYCIALYCILMYCVLYCIALYCVALSTSAMMEITCPVVVAPFGNKYSYHLKFLKCSVKEHLSKYPYYFIAEVYVNMMFTFVYIYWAESVNAKLMININMIFRLILTASWTIHNNGGHGRLTLTYIV